MATSPQALVREALRARVRDLFSLDLETVALEYPPSLEMGDLACPIAFELARKLKRNPREIAREIVSGMPAVAGVGRVEIAGGGYINVFYDRAAIPRMLLAEIETPSARLAGAGKVIVEHTNINPNKAAHIGHLRNAVLGDTLVRLLRRAGHDVEVQNYIDDTGVQVADLVVGFIHLRGLSSVEAIERAVPKDAKFDYFCWDLYSQVTEFYEEDQTRLALRASTLKMMEEGEGAEGILARYLAPRIVRCHLETMERIGVRYDLLPWESHIIGLKFWARAFELLKAAGAIRHVDEGERRGCWIMELPGSADAAPDEAKIIVRSNGTVTYVGKDIAYQLWKMGLLGADFQYRPFHTYDARPDEGGAAPHVLWSTTDQPGARDHPRFGGGSRVYNVIDVRQSYLQRVVQQGLRALGHEEAADRSHHFAYEMVALTPACARRLGLPVSQEDEGRSHIEMSGRRGYGVKADDLIDALISAAREEVLKRETEPGASADEIAVRVAVGALRFFMIKYTRNKVIAFDFDEVLGFEGETGPYLLYSVVRARNIFTRMAEREGFDPARIGENASLADFSFLGEALDDHWELLSLMTRFDEAVEQAIRSLEPSIVARYAFTLAQRFSHFYHQFQVMNERDPNLKSARIVLTHLFLRFQSEALDLMGIEVPPRM
ncbi:MAG TPA: arginine--tRNA ligase [Candidatus Polarisedimenticolia bacterium]|jgi:arginyl-tRNA synthetase